MGVGRAGLRTGRVLHLLAIWIIGGVPLFAHHSTAAVDMTRATTVSGTGAKFLWANPHSYIDLDVQGDYGGVEHWRLEIEAVNLLRRYGWTKDTLRAGDKITCTGARAKDPTVFAQKCITVEFPDGRKLTATPF